MESHSMLCGSLDGRWVWDRMYTSIRMAESLHCSAETITTLLSGYTPIKNKKFRRKKNYCIYFCFFGLVTGHAGSQLPDQGLNLCSLHWKFRVLTTALTGNSLSSVFKTRHLFGAAVCYILFCVPGRHMWVRFRYFLKQNRLKNKTKDLMLCE